MITRLTAAAGLLALSASFAVAQTPTATPAEPATKADSNLKECQVGQVAKVGLAQALATAESQGDEKGGRAIDADFREGRQQGSGPLRDQGRLPERQAGRIRHQRRYRRPLQDREPADRALLHPAEGLRLPERQDLAEGRAGHRRAEGRRRQGLRGRGREGRFRGPVRDQGRRRRQGAGDQGRAGRQGPELRRRAAAQAAAARPVLARGARQSGGRPADPGRAAPKRFMREDGSAGAAAATCRPAASGPEPPSRPFPS